MKQTAGLGLVVLLTLTALAGVGLLAVARRPVVPPPAPVGPAGASSPAGASQRPQVQAGPSSPTVEVVLPTGKTAATPTEAPTPAGEDLASYTARMQRHAASATKGDYRALLQHWRTGKLERARERVLDDLLAKAQQANTRPPGLDKAAGRLFLDPHAPAPQRRALAALLAGSGSEAAVGYLLGGVAADSPARADALTALKTVSTPGVLPLLKRTVDARPSDLELRAAIGAALRNIDTPKARDLERQLNR